MTFDLVSPLREVIIVASRAPFGDLPSLCRKLRGVRVVSNGATLLRFGMRWLARRRIQYTATVDVYPVGSAYQTSRPPRTAT